MPRSRPAWCGCSPSPTSGHRVRFTTRWTVYQVRRPGATPHNLPNRHKSTRWPWVDAADPRSGVLPGGGHGDGVGLRPPRAAAGDGLPGADARARPGDLVRAIDRPDRGGAAVWAGPLPRLAYVTDGGNHQARYYHRVLRRMSDPHHRPTTGVAVGGRLLPRLRVRHEAVRGAVRDARAGRAGAEDAAVAEGEAAGDLPGAALGGGLAAAE